MAKGKKQPRAAAARSARTVVVAGDVSIDWLSWPEEARTRADKGPSVPNWQQVEGTRWVARPGGAWLLVKLLDSALKGTRHTVHPPLPLSDEDLRAQDAETYIHSMVDLELKKPDEDAKKVADKAKAKAEEDGIPLPRQEAAPEAYRVRQERGYCGPTGNKSPPRTSTSALSAANVLVLDDSANGFRNKGGGWERLLRTTTLDWLIVKMARPLAFGDGEENVMWNVARRGPLRPRKVRGRNGRLVEKLAHDPDRLIVVANARDLRQEKIRISERLSWERTAEDFVRELGSNGKLDTLATCANLIVRFDCDGVIHHRGNSVEEPILYFDRNHAEGEFVDGQGGRMIGMSAAFTAGLAATLASTSNPRIALKNGILAGMSAARRLGAAGFVKNTRDNKPDYPLKQAFERGRPTTISDVPIRSRDILHDRSWRWSILDQTLGNPDNAARTVVGQGVAALKRAPVAKFGDLQTADRREIEGYRAIGNLLRQYLAQPQTKPISIGVFGPPGSGKSFGVEQVAVHVARAAARGREIRRLEFNLSQYTSLEELTAAFHLVRDCGLSGKIPLAFFDEFDSDFGKPMGWLKYFLAPMQSGTFLENGHEHPLGSAIFVFAGGTCPNLATFTAPMGDAATAEQKQRFAEAKGPDFASRLRGHVDIMGANPFGTDDRTYPVRRAFLLRSMIERNYKKLLDKEKIAQIDDGVLHALLSVPAFHHGVRSIEAILAMSALSDATRFTGASLPPIEQLALHVDPADFMMRVAGERLDVKMREPLGNLLHDVYRDKKRAMAASKRDRNERKKAEEKLEADPAMAPWSDLDEAYRESSCLQADDIPRKLRAIDCFMAPKIDGRTATTFTDDDVNRLALQRRAAAQAMAQGAARPGRPHQPVSGAVARPDRGVERRRQEHGTQDSRGLGEGRLARLPRQQIGLNGRAAPSSLYVCARHVLWWRLDHVAGVGNGRRQSEA